MPMSNPYIDTSGNPQILLSYCVYMDILGFAESIKESDKCERSQTLLGELHTALKDATILLRTNSETPLPSHQYKSFTDNIVVGYPFGDSEVSGRVNLMLALLLASSYQLSLATNGFFVRGSITIGDLHISEDIVFGKALLDAISLETKVARNPRVVLSKDVRSLIKEFTESTDGPRVDSRAWDVLVDSDQQWYVHYLEGLDQDWVFWDYVEEHRGRIWEMLTKFTNDPRIWAKYAWLASYHNWFCRSKIHKDGFGEEYLLAPVTYSSEPKTLANAMSWE